jgi:iodotyrosine deiodinase
MMLLDFERKDEEVMRQQSKDFFEAIARRRTVREFSDDPIPLAVVRQCILAAGTAPSGAHKQPWSFSLVTDLALKRAIRLAAEKEEKANYKGRMSRTWLKDLEPFATDHNKPHIETAPAVIVMFRKPYDMGPNGEKQQNYYVTESAGIAAGFLLTALHLAGLATLTHTPSPMKFLAELLGRPENERAFLLIPVGYPIDGCTVPDIVRKPLDAILTEYR